ncbi:hypothetical protein PILCRDRAFT_829944 [Piloderma croceum F 1598]|uniref:Uncharacterized protein n=1 Tax=Piloderma croceum (strain F 1598) TaxID=765440 RepID=A0A0C3EWR2_PILCF|nr:hypothetical protein PILCRDRAFT_829944 [Piloderma croceum F 1598]
MVSLYGLNASAEDSALLQFIKELAAYNHQLLLFLSTRYFHKSTSRGIRRCFSWFYTNVGLMRAHGQKPLECRNSFWTDTLLDALLEQIEFREV